MPEIYQFTGPPDQFRPDQWDRLEQLVTVHDQIEIELIVDLPTLGRFSYNPAVEAVQEKLRSVLTKRLGRRVEVEFTARIGGRAVKCGFRISS